MRAIWLTTPLIRMREGRYLDRAGRVAIPRVHELVHAHVQAPGEISDPIRRFVATWAVTSVSLQSYRQ